MSYLHDLCLLAFSNVQHILCCVLFGFVCIRHVSCVPNDASFFVLSILDCLFGLPYRLFTISDTHSEYNCINIHASLNYYEWVFFQTITICVHL